MISIIWVRISPSANEIYSSPIVGNKDYHNFVWQTKVRGDLVNILENFLDGTHTHFVHSGLIRSKGKRQKVSANIKRINDRVEIKYTGESKQPGIISQWFEKNRKESYGRFILPSIAEIEYCSESGSEFTITAYITPTSDDNHKIYAIISIKKGIVPGMLKQWLITPFFKKALKQDLEILKLQYQNIIRFGKEEFISTEIDLIRPHIEALLKGVAKESSKSAILSL